MDTNKMREQFESAFIEKYAADLNGKVPGITREAAIKFITCNWLARSGDDYELPVPNGAWWAWQASREAVVVELPELRSVPDRDCWARTNGLGFNNALKEARQVIEAQCLRVTP